MGSSKHLQTALVKSRQMAGTLIHKHRLTVSTDELLVARVICFRDYLFMNPEGWDKPESECFWATVNEAGLVTHPNGGISYPGEPDPETNGYNRPEFSPLLARQGRMYASAAMWDFSRGYYSFSESHWLRVHPLEMTITRIGPYPCAWWMGAIRDGDTKDESIARASRYGRWRLLRNE